MSDVHQELLTKLYGYKFNIGDIVKHTSYTDLYGEVIERGYNPATNYYLIRSESNFTARYNESDLFIDITAKRMVKLKKLGI